MKENQEALAKRAFDALTTGPKTYKALDYIKENEDNPAFVYFIRLLLIKMEGNWQEALKGLEKRVGSEIGNAINDVLSEELFKVDNGVFCNIAYNDCSEDLIKDLKKMMKNVKVIEDEDDIEMVGVNELE